MFCEKCGTELEGTEQFCAVCGNRIVVDTTENNVKINGNMNVNPQAVNNVALYNDSVSSNTENTKRTSIKPKKEKKKMSKAIKVFLIILSVLLLLVVAAGVLFLLWYTGPEQKIIRALESENYEEAISLYQDNYDGDSEDIGDIKKTLLNRLETIKTEFVAGTMEYAVADMELGVIERMGISALQEAINEVRTEIQALNQSRTAFGIAEALFAEGSYAEALEQYKLVIEEDSNYENAKSKLTQAIEKYREKILKEADDYVQQGSYIEAIAKLQEGLNIVSNDKKLQEQIAIYQNENENMLKEQALESAAEYAAQNDLKQAITTLSGALERKPDDTELTAAYNTYCQQYVQGVIAEADAFVEQEDYKGAIKCINEALKVLPGEELLASKLGEVENNKPVPLSGMDAINGGWDWNVGTPTDPFGATYSDVANYTIIGVGSLGYAEEEYVEYRLYGEYKSLSFKAVAHSEIPEDGCGTVQVYADDTLIFTSEEIRRKTDMQSYTVDISNADYIKIVIKADKGHIGTSSMSGENVILLMDCILSK